MSNIGKNIRKIRTIKKFSQSAFAELFGLSRTSVGAYEEERAEPKIDTIIQIANHFGISIDSILTKELTVNELYHFDVFREIEKKDGPKERKLSLVKSDETILYVSAKNSIEYLTHFQNKDFLTNLPTIHLPHVSGKNHRAFEIKGSAMASTTSGIMNGDTIICKKSEAKSMEANKVYVVITQNKFLCRRAGSTRKDVTLIPDNPNYETVTIPKKEILECWEAESRFTTNMNPVELADVRLGNLEKQVEDLLKRLKKVEGN